MAQRLEGTQGEWVKRQLMNGKEPTHHDLILACGGRGGHRLAAYIYKLRHKERWPIDSVALPGAVGPNPPVRYGLPPGWHPGGPVQLSLPV